MDQIFPDAGLLYILRSVVGSGLVYDLYLNDYVPVLSSQLADFQRANWSGYNSITVAAAAWTIASVAADVGKFSAPPIGFNNPSGSPVTFYGFYVKDSTNTILLSAARFDLAPITLPPGGIYPVLPILGTYSGLKK